MVTKWCSTFDVKSKLKLTLRKLLYLPEKQAAHGRKERKHLSTMQMTCVSILCLDFSRLLFSSLMHYRGDLTPEDKRDLSLSTLLHTSTVQIS